MSEEKVTPDEESSPRAPELVPLTTFLERHPPGKVIPISDRAKATQGAGSLLTVPAIQLHCDSQDCGGVRYFDPREDSLRLYNAKWTQVFLNFTCRHCKGSSKAYALSIHIARPNELAEALKFGEFPIFAPHVPSRVLSMVGTDQETFLKGRRAESLGMGIAAFAYYRRVVENQKTRLLDNIVTVAGRIKADPGAIALLEKARDETQFTTAVEGIKDAMPQILRIDGHSPLTLLHSALSEGLHAQTDDECLELATSIRVLLSELCDRINTALKDHAELKSAVSRLLNRDQPNKGKKA